MNDDLVVAVRTEDVPALQKIVPEQLEVVDLAVDHFADRAVLVEQRLIGLGTQVDDGQAPVSEDHGPARPEPVGVRAAVRKGGVHTADGLHVGGRVPGEEAGDSAHGVSIAWVARARARAQARTRTRARARARARTHGAGAEMTDVNTMFKVFRAECLDGLDLESDGFELDMELACKLARNGNSPMEGARELRRSRIRRGQEDPLLTRRLALVRHVLQVPFSGEKRPGTHP